MSVRRIGARAAFAAVGVLVVMAFGAVSASAAPPAVCESGCKYGSIQEAINNAKTGETIKIAAGTYNEHLTIPGEGTATSLTLQGAGEGETTINGTENGTVVTISSGETVAITGVTLTNGHAPLCGNGGGIYNSGTLTLKNSTVSENSAIAGHCGGNGGGIYNSGTLTLKNSTVSGNRAANDGGIYNLGTATLNNSTVTGNLGAGGAGAGGIYNGGTMTLNNSTVSENGASRGAGIENDGTATLNNSTVTGNKTSGPGGGILNHGTMTLKNSTVSGNEATYIGGGIYNLGTVTLNNSTVSGNEAANGGGIANRGSVTGDNDTITGNTPNGIVNELAGTTNLKNSEVQEP